MNRDELMEMLDKLVDELTSCQSEAANQFRAAAASGASDESYILGKRQGLGLSTELVSDVRNIISLRWKTQ